MIDDLPPQEFLNNVLEELDRECRCAAVRGEDGRRVGLAVLQKHFGPMLEIAPLTNAALRAKLATLEAENAWRPIEDEARNGDDILAVSSEGHIMVIAYEPKDRGDEFPWAVTDGCYRHKDWPVRYRPLPTPPAQGDEG